MLAGELAFKIFVRSHNHDPTDPSEKRYLQPLTLLEQFCPLGKSHSLSRGLCGEDTDLVLALVRPVHIASGGRGASAWSLWTLWKERLHWDGDVPVPHRQILVTAGSPTRETPAL